MPRKERPELRFWRKVNQSDGCWEWTGYVTKYGYGQITIAKKPQRVHRYSWSIHNGPIPIGMHVLHTCDNRKCVNPAHLFLGTNADNVADKMRKGRHRGGQLWGEEHPNSILSVSDVLAIRASAEPIRDLAKQYCMHIETIRRIRKREKWARLS